MAEEVMDRKEKQQPRATAPQTDALAESLHQREQRLIRKRDAYVTELSKSAVQRTQEAADRRFDDGKNRYKVSIPKDKVQPEVVLRANSPEEAKGRYDIICGIRQCDHEHAVVLAA